MTDTQVRGRKAMTDEQIAIRLGILPEPPKPEPPPLPRPKATSIRRWIPDDFDDWLFERIEERWPKLRSFIGWRTYLGNMAGSNDYLFITNGRGLLLARVDRHMMTQRPVVVEGFAWSRDARLDKRGGVNWIVDAEYEDDFYALYRHCKAWAVALKAVRCIFGTCSDMSATRLKQGVGGDTLVDVLL